MMTLPCLHWSIDTAHSLWPALAYCLIPTTASSICCSMVSSASTPHLVHPPAPSGSVTTMHGTHTQCGTAQPCRDLCHVTLAESDSPYLCPFVVQNNLQNNPSSHCFSREELEPITADELYRWTKHQVYSNETVDEGTVPLVHYRACTILSWKMTISF